MNLKEKFKNYIKNIAREVVDEKQAATDEFSGNYTLPEIDRNKLLAKSIQKTHRDLVADIPVGVAMDACCNTDKFNDYYNISNPVDDIIYTHFATQCFIGFQACAILTQNWLINKACLLPTKDAIRPDYELSYVTTDENEVIDKDFLTKITDLSNDAKHFNIKEVARTFAEKKRQFGQCLAFPIVEGADYSSPFNIDSIKPDSYKGMTVVDPVWYQAILDDEAISDPTSLRYMKPTYFQMPNGVKVHYSWCIFNTNGDVPDILKPTYRWGGYPIPQLIYKRAYAAEKTANEAPMLAQSKRLLITDINPKNYFVNQRETEEQLKVLCNFRDNFGVMTKRPGESVQQIDTSLTDLDEVIMTQFQLTAAAAGITATKLLETQPKGFNSTGDYEDKNYKLTCVSIQKEDYIPILDLHYRLLSVSKYGINRNYTINFKEIDTPTEKERAEINEIKARTDATYIDAGILTQDEVRDNLITDPNSGYNDIEGDIADEDYSDEEQEGNGETQQNPFNFDSEWKESEHPRKKNGQFGKGGSSKTTTPYKKEIAGTKPQSPMSINKALKGTNPNFNKAKGYGNNCQSCVAVFEARLRGYNLEVLPKTEDNKFIQELSKRPELAYIDKKTYGYPKVYKCPGTRPDICEDWLNNSISKGQRWVLTFANKNNDNAGHVVIVTKDDKGNLKFLDPQSGEEFDNKYISNIDFFKISDERVENCPPKIFRVDDKELNTPLLDKISKKENN